MTIFINGKQKRVPRPPQIDEMDVEKFIRQDAGPIWLHQNGMWESMSCDDADDGPCRPTATDPTLADRVGGKAARVQHRRWPWQGPE